MEGKVYLKRYRLYLDQVGLPTVIRRSATEATFRAEDLGTGKDVAVQIVPLTSLRTLSREELETEANAAQELEHINIPRLRAFGFEDDHIIYVTEYFHGTTAAEWIKTKGPMPIGAVLRIAMQVVNASSTATFHGLLNYAINPHNLMLVPGHTNEGEAPLIKLLNVVGATQIIIPPGVPDPDEPINFVSPEQMQTGVADFPSHIYALGATLWFLLTGAAPADGSETVEKTGQLPAAGRHLLAQMLALNPEERPLDPLVLQTQIQDCLAQLDRRDAVATKFGLPLASEATAPKNMPRRANIWRPIALAAILLGLASLTALYLSRHSRPRAAIGVTVGVPEASPIAGRTDMETKPAERPAVLTSTADTSSEEQDVAATSSTADENSEKPAEVTSNAAPEILPNESSTGEPTVTIAAAAESPVPAEAPIVEQEQTAVAQTKPPAEPTNTPTANEPPVILAAATPTDRPTPIPIQKTRPRISKVTVNESRPTPPPRAMERAQFLGMTPDGNLIYGSSSEKVLAAPAIPREEAPRRKASPRASPVMIDGLPVRPALPPDQ